MLACLLAALGNMALAQDPPKAPWRLESHSTTLIAIPAAIRLAAVDLEYGDAEPLKGVVVDLNEDGVHDYLLQSAPSLCGNGGCAYVLCDGATGRKIGEFFGSPIVVRAERRRGYPDIETYSQMGAGSGDHAEYGFDGAAYVVTARRTVEGETAARLLETLRRAPVWQPRPVKP